MSTAQDGAKVSQYVQLFDAIDEMEYYDEEELVRKHKRKAFVKNLGMTKQYLQENILKSLCSFHTGIGIENDVYEKIKAAEIMKEKGLVSVSSKLLKKARSNARKYEKYNLLLQISQMEVMQLYPNDPEFFYERLTSLYDEQVRALEIMRLDSEYYRLWSITFAKMIQITYSRTQEDIDALRDLLAHPLLSDPGKPHSVGQKVFFYGILSRCHFILGDYDQAYGYAKKEVATWEEMPHKIEERPLRYAKILKNFAIRCLKAERLDDVYSVVRKFRALPNMDMRLRKFKFQAMYTLEITYYLETGEYEKALELIPEIENENKEIGDSVTTVQRVVVLHNVMQACAYAGKHLLALDYANAVLNEEEVLPDLYGFTKIVAALLHYDLGNVDAFENALRSAQRYFKKRGRLLQFEDQYLKCLKKIDGIAEAGEMRAYYEQQKKQLQIILQDPNEARALEYFDFIAWLESKIEDRPLRAILMRKVRERSSRQAQSSTIE